MDSFHCHLDELERLLSDDDKMRRIRQRALCYAVFVGFSSFVEAVIQKGVGKEYRHSLMRACRYRIADYFGGH